MLEHLAFYYFLDDLTLVSTRIQSYHRELLNRNGVVVFRNQVPIDAGGDTANGDQLTAGRGIDYCRTTEAATGIGIG